MASKAFTVPLLGTVTIYKRRGSRSVRLSVPGAQQVRITMPYWTPYATGLAFAGSKQAWILSEQAKYGLKLIQPSQAVGKAHHVQFLESDKLATRLQGSTVLIKHPPGQTWQDPIVQLAARKACLRALRQEAEQLLPQRLSRLADERGLTYKSVTIKQLKRRWGSCDQHNNLTFNFFLMQLPWHLIDYVIFHELAHTRHHNHSADFWSEMDKLVPNVSQLRKEMRSHQPDLISQA